MVLETIIIWVLTIVVHELSHYVGYMLCGYKPDIKIKWWGILIGENVWKEVKVKHATIISYLGVVVGAIPIYVYSSNYYFLIYIIMSCIDISNIISLMGAKRHERSMTVRDFVLKQLSEKDGA